MKNLKQLHKRGLSLFVALMMCLSLVQVTAMAEDDPEITPTPCACGVEGCTCAPETCGADFCNAPCEACADKQQADKEAAEEALREAEEKDRQEAAEKAVALAAELQTMISNLPAPETVTPEDQTVYNQIAAVYSFAETNELALTEAQETTLSLVSQALTPVSVIPEEPENGVTVTVDTSSLYPGIQEVKISKYSIDGREVVVDATSAKVPSGANVYLTVSYDNNADNAVAVFDGWPITEGNSAVEFKKNITQNTLITCIGLIYWDISGSTLTISGQGAMPTLNGNFNAPWTDNKFWSSGSAAQWNCANTSIQTVVIGSGITSIGNSSFNTYKNLTDVSIPDTVVTMEGWIFHGCTNLKTVQLPSNLGTMGQQVFTNCTALESVAIPDSVTSIGVRTFYGCCNLKSAILPYSIDSIPAYTFANCTALTNVVLPTRATTIGDSAFQNCESLPSVVIPDNITTIGGGTFAGCKALTSAELPDGITSIPNAAFQGCVSLASITLPDGVTSIGNRAFADCTALKNIKLPDSLTSLPNPNGSFAFQNAGLTSIIIPAGITGIPCGLLQDCTNLQAVVILSDNLANMSGQGTAIHVQAFSNTPAIIYKMNDQYTTNINWASTKHAVGVTNGGTFPENTVFKSNELATPVKEGQKFEGWYTDSTLTKKATTVEMGKAYYAKWSDLSTAYSVGNIAFSDLAFGVAPTSKSISVTSSSENPTINVTSNSDFFTFNVDGMNITVTPKSSLDAGNYSGILYVATGDGATLEATVSLTVLPADSTTNSEADRISATYGDSILLSASIAKAETPNAVAFSSRIRRAAPVFKDEASFYYVDATGTETYLGSSPVRYDGAFEGVSVETRTSGKAEFVYDTSLKILPIGESTVKVTYTGNVNLDESTTTLTVTLTPKPLTVTGLTAVGRQENGSNVVAIGGTAVLDGIIANDTVVPVASAFGTMADSASGSGKAVTVPVSLGGTHSVWYTVSPVTLTVNISAAPVVDNPIVFPSFTPTYPTGGGTGNGGTTNPPTTITDPDTPLDDGTTITDDETPLVRNPLLFRDVPEDMWCRDAVAYVFDKGLMKGISDTVFAPAMSTERGMIVTILHRLEGEPTAAASSFTDVTAGKWYTDAIAWGAANGVVEGYSDTIFKPTQDITREQLAAILFRYAQLKGYDTSKRADLSAYTDAGEISAYALEAMRWAVAEELISGVTSYTLVPSGRADRAQVATILMRFCENIVPA